jgi:hypothetical protein
MHAHSPRVLSPREPELPVYAVLALHKHKSPKFVSWVDGGARLGKAQVHKLGRWWRPLGIDLVFYNRGIYFRCLILVLYILYYIIISIDFIFWVIYHFISFM